MPLPYVRNKTCLSRFGADYQAYLNLFMETHLHDLSPVVNNGFNIFGLYGISRKMIQHDKWSTHLPMEDF
ncbi:MAG: hypothetical protein IPH28_25350 [Cytophagaceae bacterium]|nr:hypothetical protein [Cytophagaceae bacterium]